MGAGAMTTPPLPPGFVLETSATTEDPAQAPPSARPMAEPTLTERIMAGAGVGAGMLDQAGRGVAEGVMNIAGLPADLFNIAPMALNLLPGEQGFQPIMDEPYFGSARLKRGLDTANNVTADVLGMQRPMTAPDNIGERMINRVGEEIGAAALPTAGIIAKAGQVGVQGAREGGRISRMFLEPAAVNPTKFAAKEMAYAGAAGQGAAIANEIAPDSQVADIVGALGGAGALAFGSKVGRSGLEVANALRGSPNYADDVVREAVTDSIAAAAGLQAPKGQAIDTEALVQAISGGPRVAEAIPGFQESLADRTGNAGLAALEYSRQTGPNSGTFTQRRAENTAAVDAAMGRSAPNGQPGAFSDALADARDDRLIAANQAAREAEDAAALAIAPIQPGDTPQARGETVRTVLDERRAEARERTAGAYTELGIDDIEGDSSALTKMLDDAREGLNPVERSLLPNDLIESVAALGRSADPEVPSAPITMKVVADLKSELQDLQTAAKAEGRRNPARVLGKIIKTTDNYINSNLTPDKAEALEAARGAKFAESEAFDRKGDPIAAVLAQHQGGRFKVADPNVARKFLDPQSMDYLFAQADTPEVRTAIRNELLERANTDSVEGLQDFITSHAEQLNRFPGLRAEAEAASRARGVERVAKTAETGIVRELGTEGRGVVAKYLQYGDENAEKAMKAVMANKKPEQAIDELLTFVGDEPAAVEGARKVFWDIMQKSSRSAGETTATMGGTQPWMPKALKRFLDDPPKQAVAERLWRDQPEHLENIRTIADALQNVDVRNRAKAPNTSGTAQGVNPLLTPETFQSRFYAYQSGRISGSFLITSIAAVTGRRAVKKAQSEGIQRMLDEVLVNPDAAALLLKENNPANRAALARKAKTWFGNEASTIINMINGDDEDDDPVVRAATR